VSGRYRIMLAWGLFVIVEWVTDRRFVTDYSVVLAVDEGDETHTIRVYDGAHGVNELHRYTRRGGKASAETFHRGTLAKGCGRRSPKWMRTTKRFSKVGSRS
jgi:hypothetical protein